MSSGSSSAHWPWPAQAMRSTRSRARAGVIAISLIQAVGGADNRTATGAAVEVVVDAVGEGGEGADHQAGGAVGVTAGAPAGQQANASVQSGTPVRHSKQ